MDPQRREGRKRAAKSLLTHPNARFEFGT